ncbi:hypothetical protein AAFN47_23500 [Hoeflea sp. CAU 1731]
MPGHDPTRFISPSALMISMGVNLVRDRAQGRETLAGFDLGDEAFEMRLAGDRLQTASVRTPDAPFVLHGNGTALAKAVYGAIPLPTLVAQGVVDADGDIAAAQDFLSLFTLQPQA